MSSPVELGGSPSDIVSSLRFSPSGENLVVASWDGAVYFYTRNEGGEEPFHLAKTIQTENPILDVAWGANDDTLYTVGLSENVQQIDLASSEDDTTTLSTHAAPTNKVAYSTPHKLVLSTSWDSSLHVSDPATGRHAALALPAKPFALSLTAARAVVAMASRKVSIFDLAALATALQESGSEQADAPADLQVQPWQQRESSLKFMTRAVACMPDGAGYASSSIEGRVAVDWFDPAEQARTYAFKCHRQSVAATAEEEAAEGAEKVDVVYPVNALAFHPVHGTFATGGGDGVVAMWDAQSRRRVRQYPKLGASVAAMDFSRDGRFLAVGVSPGFEDGVEREDMDMELVRVVVRELGEGEAKGKAAKGT